MKSDNVKKKTYEQLKKYLKNNQIYRRNQFPHEGHTPPPTTSAVYSYV